MENEIDFSLPEWVFLDGNSHLGDTLDDRVILQHNPSFTIMEIFMQGDNPVEPDSSVKSKEFTYLNVFGEIETHLVAVHFSLDADFELDRILDEAIEFYKLFMDWEDTSLVIEETSKDN
jgi:hypothetical protein